MPWSITPRIAAGLAGVAVTATCTVYFTTAAPVQWPPLLAAGVGALSGALAASLAHQARHGG